MGLLLAVAVHPANIQGRDGAKLVTGKLLGRLPRLRLIWADGGYRGQLADWIYSLFGWALEIVPRPKTLISLRCCPGAGWWKGRWPGWAGAGG